MNKYFKSISAIAVVAVLFACDSAPKPEIEPKAEVAEKVEAKPALDSANQVDAKAVAAAELEKKRKELEDLINKIMSEDVYFEYDKTVLTEKARELLAQVGDALLKEAQFEVLVEGHTDTRGTEAYNMSLGSKRAQNVQDYLLNYGVSNDRIFTRSFGEEKIKVEGEDEVAHSKNRRANFRVRVKE